MNELATLDIAVILVYLLGIVIYGISKSKRSSSEDYFLGGRTMTWPIVGIALFSANISSSTLVGLASDAFQTNINVYNYEWYAVVVLIFFAIFFLPFYIRSGVYTMPEFLERRYDKKSRYYFSFITILGNVMVDTAAGLYVGSIVLKLLFPEVSSTIIIIILAVAAAAYEPTRVPEPFASETADAADNSTSVFATKLAATPVAGVFEITRAVRVSPASSTAAAAAVSLSVTSATA